MTCSPRTALLEHVDFRIPPGVHAVSVARRQTSVGLVEDDAWQGRRWSMIGLHSFGWNELSPQLFHCVVISLTSTPVMPPPISRGRHQHLWLHSLQHTHRLVTTTMNMVARRPEVLDVEGLRCCQEMVVLT